jgi:hypothetical protein
MVYLEYLDLKETKVWQVSLDYRENPDYQV